MRQREASGIADLDLVSKAVGPLPLINHVLRRLRLAHFFGQAVPPRDRRTQLAPAVGLGALLRNVLVAREPLYSVSAWARRFEPALLGLGPGDAARLNDDRVGRCLDRLFLADRPTLLTTLMVHATRTFALDLRELHNDSTTVTFTGQYSRATGAPYRGRPTHRITHGFNKDHRPDLKQLLSIRTTSADGAVPVWYRVDHGNTTDDQTHLETWDTLRRLVGRPDFRSVADSKLCTRENMQHLQREGGRFLTVLPKTRREDTWFRDWIQTHAVPWVELLRRRHPRRQHAPDDVYRGVESPRRSVEGYRLLWFWSSQKAAQDREARERRLQHAGDELDRLRARVHAPRSRLKTLPQVRAAAEAVLAQTQAARWLAVEVTAVDTPVFKQATAGRPGPRTRYVRHRHTRLELHWTARAEALQYDAHTDGLFPLILNDETLSLREALLAYKRQPALEKRHEQFKSVLEVRPMLLKSPTRIEAFLFVYFVALLVEALVERELRRRMKAAHLPTLPLYPEGRPCQCPTADRIFRLFDDVRRHRLLGPGGDLHKCFCDPLTPLQGTVLRLLGLSETAYFAAAEEGTGASA